MTAVSQCVNTKSATLQYYHQLGGNLFPCQKCVIGDSASKQPLHPSWQTRRYPDDELSQYAENGHGIGVAIAPSIAVIDIDAPTAERPNKRGPESWQRLLADCGIAEPTTFSVDSPSGGRHLYFTLPADVPIRGRFGDEYPDIDVLSRGKFVLIAGSPHWQGGYYNADPFGMLCGPVELPPALLHRLQRQTSSTSADSFQISADDLERLLALISPEAFRDHPKWLQLAMACHAACGDAGEPIFKAWCWSDPLYNGDETIEARWDSFKSDGGVTGQSLLYLVREEIKDDPEALAKFGRIMADIDFADDLPVEPNAEAVKRPERKTILCDGNDEHEIVLKCLAELPRMCRDHSLYARNRELVQVALTESLNAGCQPELIQLDETRFRTLVTSVVNFCKTKELEGVTHVYRVRPPAPILATLFFLGDWPDVPKINRIAAGPSLLPNGNVLSHGYDSEFGILYSGSAVELDDLSGPILQAEAREAADRLLDVVCDFPFAAEAHRSVWLSFLLTLVARHAVLGPVPMFAYIANTQSAGKSLLVKLASVIAYGYYDTTPMSAKDDAEFEKRFVASQRRGKALLVLDNEQNGGTIGGPYLDQLLTSPRISGRILGQSRMIEFDNAVSIAVTGNGLTISPTSDTARRTLVSFLDKVRTTPQFKYGPENELLAHVRANRAKLVSDALRVLLAWCQSGQKPAAKPMASFELWDNVVRQALLWIGLADPCDGMRQAPLAVDESSAVTDRVVTGIGGLIQRWSASADKKPPVRLRELVSHMNLLAIDAPNDATVEGFQDAIEALGLDVHRFTSRELGYKLRAYNGKPASNGQRLIADRHFHGWSLQ